MNQMKVGLVLSGGGAKGAYQVGVVKALHETGTQVDAIAGASIGALNGAILAAAPSLKIGGDHLEQLWLELATESPLHYNFPAYLQILLASGLHLYGVDAMKLAIERILSIGHRIIPTSIAQILSDFLPTSGMFKDSPLQRHIDEYLSLYSLNSGLPLYVSVYRKEQTILDLLRVLVAELGFNDSPPAEFLHIQSLQQSEQKDALLASAAIPLLFAPKKVNDTLYSDGGLGGWQKMQGNTPITPLLEAGCNMVIVTHLSDGSLWSRHDFPDAIILEIRPQSNIKRDGSASDLLGFGAEKITSWIEQGYQDTLHCVGRVMNASKARIELKISEAALRRSQDSLRLDQEMDGAMRRLL